MICIIFVAKITIIWNNIMKRTILFSITLLISALAIVGCCDCRKRSKLEKPLVGTTWQLVQLMGREVAATGDSYTLCFSENGTAAASDDTPRDSNGAELLDGDSVTVIKDLKVKGSSMVIKRGTKVKSIRLTDNHEEVDCKIDGSSIVLKTCFLKK